MTATTVPGPRRTQAVWCETCRQRLPSLMADCVNALCVAATIDYLAREDLRVEAVDG